jgi:hypothetical protein
MKSADHGAEGALERGIVGLAEDGPLSRLIDEAQGDAIRHAIGVVFAECQPSHGDLFGRIDDKLRALLDGDDR